MTKTKLDALPPTPCQAMIKMVRIMKSTAHSLLCEHIAAQRMDPSPDSKEFFRGLNETLLTDQRSNHDQLIQLYDMVDEDPSLLRDPYKKLLMQRIQDAIPVINQAIKGLEELL